MPLQTLKFLRETHGTRSANSWYQLTREVARKSGVRLEALADRVHHPKPSQSYHTIVAVLECREADRHELQKMEEHALSDPHP